MTHAMSTPPLDTEALSAEVASLLGRAPVAETTGAKLGRLLDAFLQVDVLPLAERAAGLGIDPAPLLAVVTDVLRLYADALEPPARAERRPGEPVITPSG